MRHHHDIEKYHHHHHIDCFRIIICLKTDNTRTRGAAARAAYHIPYIIEKNTNIIITRYLLNIIINIFYHHTSSS